MQHIARVVGNQRNISIYCRCYSTNSKNSTFDASSSKTASSSKASFASQAEKLREDFKKAKTDQQVKDWIQSKPAISKFKDSVEREKSRLEYELKTTPLGELREFEKLNHKLFEADTKLLESINSTLFPFNDAFQFASVENGETLKLRKYFSNYKATVVVVSFIKFSSAYNDKWVDYLQQKHKILDNSTATSKPISLLDLTVTEGSIYQVKFLQNFMNNNLRKQTSPERLACNYVWYPKKDEGIDFKKQLNIYNAKSNYVYLVDKNGKIRWRACGSPKEEELNTLSTCINQLTHGY